MFFIVGPEQVVAVKILDKVVFSKVHLENLQFQGWLKTIFKEFWNLTLHKKCPYSELFWSVISRIQT